MKTFTMNDLSKLVEIVGSSSESDDRLPAFSQSLTLRTSTKPMTIPLCLSLATIKGLRLSFSILIPFMIEPFPSCIVKRLKAVSLFWNGRI